jgi:copper chaperone CopZ
MLTVALIGFALDDARGWLRKLQGRTTPAPSKKVVEVAVTGLTCNGCVRKLKSKLDNTDGIDEADVTLEPGRARVVGVLDSAAVCAVVRSAGYGATPV